MIDPILDKTGVEGTWDGFPEDGTPSKLDVKKYSVSFVDTRCGENYTEVVNSTDRDDALICSSNSVCKKLKCTKSKFHENFKLIGIEEIKSGNGGNSGMALV